MQACFNLQVKIIMKLTKLVGFFLALLFTGLNSFAIDNTSQVSATISKNLRSNLPNLTIDRIIPTQIPGVYEVDSGRKVFYVDATGNYAFVGNLLDLTNKNNLTEARTEALNRIDFNRLPVEIAIRKVIGNGKDKIAVFTDPDCPFCKRLEGETIPKLKNVTVYYFLFPLPIHAGAVEASKRILCSENAESAMVTFMVKGGTITRNDNCDNAKRLLKMQDAGNNLVQVTGTPTIVLPNGKIVSGLIPADYLTKLIDDNNAESATPATKTGN